MLKIAICDDNKYICSQIEQIILDYKKLNSVDIDIEVFYSGESLIDFIENDHSFDLIFLDIELGTTTGIEIGSKIRNEFDDYISKIVFISAVSGYEMELFNIQPLNFLKKPLSKEDVYGCISLAKKITIRSRTFFEFKQNKDKVRINTDTILYLESSSRKINVITSEKTFVFYGKLSLIKEDLPNNFFIPHNSYIVNYNKVHYIYVNKIIMENEDEIPISKKFQEDIKNFQIRAIRENKDGFKL